MTNSTTPTWEGGCLCGAIRFRVAGPVENPCCCHCRSCRLASGAPFMVWGTFRADGFEIVRGTLTERISSARAARGFCAECGTALTYRPTLRDGDMDLSLAALDDAAALAPETHIWVSHKAPWLVLCDGLPQHSEGLPPS